MPCQPRWISKNNGYPFFRNPWINMARWNHETLFDEVNPVVDWTEGLFLE